MLIAQRAHPASFHDKPRLRQGLLDPSHGKRPEDMSVRDHDDIARTRVVGLLLILPHIGLVMLRPDLTDELVNALDHVLGRLPARTPVTPDIPGVRAGVGALLLDLFACDAFVVAVVPLADLVCDRDFRVRVSGGIREGAVARRCGRGVLPGVWRGRAEIEELHCSLGALHGGDVAVFRSVSLGQNGPILCDVLLQRVRAMSLC